MIDILLWPFLATLVLTGIHTYVGIKVVNRGIIFIDLALAQFAVLGGLIGFGLGIEHPIILGTLSVSGTIVGAILLDLCKHLEPKLPHEALIGCLYATSSAIALLILSYLPSEASHLQKMLTGDILFVSPADVITMTMLYAILGIFLWIGQKKIKDTPILFYLILGLIVTSSVKIAGVLLVFTYLIMPALAGLYSSDTRPLTAGWLFGAIASLSGMVVSVFYDWPTGPSIILCASLLLAAILSYIYSQDKS